MTVSNVSEGMKPAFNNPDPRAAARLQADPPLGENPFRGTLDGTFWQSTGKERPRYAAALSLVYGDLVEAGKMKPDAGDCGLMIARAYEVAVSTPDGDRLWELANDAIHRLKGHDNPNFHKANTRQIALELAGELDGAKAAKARGEDYRAKHAMRWIVDRYSLTPREAKAIKKAAETLCRLPGVAVRERKGRR